MISESDFWRVQALLDNKKPLKCLPSNEVPLRGILKCVCGLPMTAGNSKGKKKYYTYYRCQKHNNINLPAISLHGKLNQILELFNFKPDQLDYITKSSKSKMEEALINRNKQLAVKSQQLSEINNKIEHNEERLMNDVIEEGTYKKWYRKYMEQKAFLTEEVNGLNKK